MAYNGCTRESLSVNGNWTYGYDPFNRLATSNKNSGATTYGYAYDRFGGWVTLKAISPPGWPTLSILCSERVGLLTLRSLFASHPQKPFSTPNSRSTLIFDRSLQNT